MMSDLKSLRKRIEALEDRVHYLETKPPVYVPPPTYAPINPLLNPPTTLDFTSLGKEEPCLFDGFKDEASKGKAIGLACPCPKCSPRC